MPRVSISPSWILILGIALFTTGCGIPGASRLGLKTTAHSPTPEQSRDVQLSLARTLERQGDLDRAAFAYQQILTRFPDDPTAVHRLAIVTGRLQRFDESLKLFEKALRLHPGDANIFCDLGYTYYLQGQWAEAEMNLQQAVTLEPYHRRAHNHLGMLFAQTSRHEDALAEFRKAGCSPAESHVNMAVAFALSNRLDSAREELDQAVAVGGGSEAIHQKVTQVEQFVASATPRDAERTYVASAPTETTVR